MRPRVGEHFSGFCYSNFALPGIYEFLEAEGFRYAIRLPANRVLQDSIGHLLKRPVGRPPKDVRRYYATFSYRAATWTKPRRVVAKVEWHPGELYPRVGFIVTNLSRRAERVVAFYNQRGTAEQHIKEGKNAIKWTRLSCRRFDHNAVRLQLHALAYNLCNFMRTLALPDAVEQWSLTSLREKLIKIGAKIVRHGRYVTFQMAEVAIPRDLFACQWRSKKGPPRRCKKGPLGGCGLVPVVHGRAPRATRRALNRLTRRRAREGPVGPRGQAWAGWSVQLAVGV